MTLTAEQLHEAIRILDAAKRTLVDLTQPTGPPLTTTQLARAVSLSPRTIRQEIAYGEIRAGAKRGPRGRRTHLIPWDEAQRYAIQVGVIRRDA